MQKSAAPKSTYSLVNRGDGRMQPSGAVFTGVSDGRHTKGLALKMCKSQNGKQCGRCTAATVLMPDELYNWLLIMDLRVIKRLRKTDRAVSQR